MFLWLAALVAQAAPAHALYVGGAGGVDFYWKSPEARTFLGSPVVPAVGWTFDPGGVGRLWGGVHSAPLLFFTGGCTADADVIQCWTTGELLMGDLGWGFPIGGDRGTVGPFLSAGLLAGETGLRLRYAPRRLGAEVRAAWAWPKGFAATAALSVALGR